VSRHSTDGRKWARLSQLRPGDTVEIDDGFRCMTAGRHVVEADEDGLFLPCDDGRHYLAGQADAGEHCIGIWPVAPDAAPATEAECATPGAV